MSSNVEHSMNLAQRTESLCWGAIRSGKRPLWDNVRTPVMPGGSSTNYSASSRRAVRALFGGPNRACFEPAPSGLPPESHETWIGSGLQRKAVETGAWCYFDRSADGSVTERWLRGGYFSGAWTTSIVSVSFQVDVSLM
jgi:hypothetical protein